MKLYCTVCQSELQKTPSEEGLSAMEEYIEQQGLNNLRILYVCPNAQCMNPTEVYVEQQE